MKITELSGVKEIARRADVSIATVDRVLHNRLGVAQKTKEKILNIIKEMDYKPNILAKRLASKRVYKFGILIPNDHNKAGYWKAPITGIESAYSEFGEFGVELSYYLFDKEDRKNFVEMYDVIFEHPVDGIILAPIFLKESMDFAIKCLENRVQYVFIESNIPAARALSYIGADLYQSGRVVGNICQYLLEEKDNVLVLNIAKNVDSAEHLEKRFEGFKDFMLETFKKINLTNINLESDSVEILNYELDKLLKKKDVRLIFVTNGRVHLVAEFIRKHKLKNVKLVGYDYTIQNIEYLKSGHIDFLICQKPIEQGYRAFVALYEHFIAKRKVKNVQFMPIDILTKENYMYYEY